MLNKVELIGRAGRDPETRITQSGAKVVKFRLATGTKDKTQWHNITCFGKSAELAEQFIQKGKLIHIDGRLDYQQWETDGVKRNRTEIVANYFLMLEPKTNLQPQVESHYSSAIPTKEELDADIPF